MTTIDVFNGDADGICALLQLRLADPLETTLVTGVKRDINLLRRVNAGAGDRVNVLDVSLAQNRDDVLRLLESGAELFYVDHHMPGEIPDHPGLHTIIDTGPDVCTSILIDRYLDGRFTPWAVTAAFGDNLLTAAQTLGRRAGLAPDSLERLKMLGICINYNGYGAVVDDLHVAPDALFRALLAYPNPEDFISYAGSCYQQLRAGYRDDIARADAVRPDYATDAVAVYILPDEAWARRVSGVFGNALANFHPQRAHAVVTANSLGGYQVSVRAPLENKTGADELCSQFPSGGGRRGAAGINHLPLDRYADFVAAFQARYA
ncbi:DHH family phosphoesterase [Sedimenticola hydrogenitrophicus]|uniref:DHH family phosphoesterase n=1 Tax=Sedimenticola hydrogenitrophicus TaxID=2967975 RepID=UPI0023B06C71|nr:DHH family phosphoesterase [Sedimenticola hydrogenitrophicus]